MLYRVSRALGSDKVNDLFAAVWGHPSGGTSIPSSSVSLVFICSDHNTQHVASRSEVKVPSNHSRKLQTSISPSTSPRTRSQTPSELELGCRRFRLLSPSASPSSVDPSALDTRVVCAPLPLRYSSRGRAISAGSSLKRVRLGTGSVVDSGIYSVRRAPGPCLRPS